ARVRLQPWFHTTNSVTLNAKGYTLHRVALFDGGDLKDLKYDYSDKEHLIVTLDRAYTRKETLEVYVEYTGHPTELDSLVNAKAAEEQGLYFINADGKHPTKPQQIWTQGESHGSPGWFPTIDHPNERCTQETYITVQDKYTTLSNGVLVNSTKNDNGTRTDYWRMTLPHAPYLFAMAIGEFAVVKDEWRGREVSYYVEPEYEKHARMIFGNTPEMLEFFSKKLGVEYPWEKYSQVVVRDFVSGAMENTTATIHMEALQHDARQHLDNTYEDYVSHELMHQWFGDLLTCESWANLPLNEGFATYGEYLWKEYKYGKDEADHHLFGDRQRYMSEARRKKEPLIRYHHRSPGSMFDSHSYQKGGLVLHMLRNVVGDEAFFASLKHYLEKNAYTDVEIAELRMAFEEVTGEDMHWFFDQWFLEAGHPELEVSYGFNGSEYKVRVEQVQDFSKYPMFKFPFELALVRGGKSERIKLWMNSVDSTYVIPCITMPDAVVFDAEKYLVADVAEKDIEKEAWLRRMNMGENYAQKREALTAAADMGIQGEDILEFFKAANDPFWGIRARAISSLERYSGDRLGDVVAEVVGHLDDEKSHVRNACLGFLEERYLAANKVISPEVRSTILRALPRAVNDSSYSVQENALTNYYLWDSAAALSMAHRLAPEAEGRLTTAIANIFKRAGDPGTLDYIESKIADGKSQGKARLVRGLSEYLVKASDAEQARGKKLIMDIVKGDDIWWLRWSVSRELQPFMQDEDVMTFLKAQVEREENETLKGIFQGMIDKA
ncbi:MAG: M1 family metallopeptidase, partial [Bacteroidota bacterium]